VYGICGGIGLGMILMLPMKCSFSYYPNHRPLLTIILMSMVLLSAMVGCLVSTLMIDSGNKRPNIIVASGKMREKFYSPDSVEVKNCKLMLQSLSFFTLIFYILAFTCIKDKN
jgi:hypothetical protein